MEAEKATFEIARMARLLEVSRSGYYDWVRRQAAGPSPAEQRRADLTAKIIHHHGESDHTYGSPRILADLREAGEKVSGKTVAKLMRAAGIAGISPRGFVPVTTQAGPDPQPLPDLVDRRFDRGGLNRVWTSDITYLATGEGWLYLCAVRDGCSRRVVGWAVEDHLHTDLVETALRRAVVLRGALPGKVIFHADRGTQYTSQQLADACAELPVLQSVGRTGVCWDNAAAESFWSTVKTELYDRRYWPTKAEARLAVGAWIEERYNRTRRHSSIGMISPVRYEELNTQVAEAA
jgi:transposase InsO family protein